MSLILLVGCSSNSTKSNESQKKSENLFKKEIKDITLAEMKVKNIPDEMSEETIEAIINPMIEQSGILVTNKTYSEATTAMIKNGSEITGGSKMSLKLTAESSEEAMSKFLKSMATLDTKFTLVNINVNKSVDKYMLELEIVFYSHKSIADFNSETNLGTVSVVENYKEEDTKVVLRNNDFFGVIRPILSDSSTVRFGLSNDVHFEKMIYDDKNDVVTVNLELTQQGKKYYFRYYTEGSIYPKDGSVEEFKPKGNKILVDILSCKRLDDTDNSGMNLVVTNLTDKKVDVVVYDDDVKTRVSQNI